MLCLHKKKIKKIGTHNAILLQSLTSRSTRKNGITLSHTFRMKIYIFFLLIVISFFSGCAYLLNLSYRLHHMIDRIYNYTVYDYKINLRLWVGISMILILGNYLMEDSFAYTKMKKNGTSAPKK